MAFYSSVLREWVAQYGSLIIEALHRYDAVSVQGGLRQAEAGIATVGLNADEAAAARQFLAYCRFQATRHFSGGEELRREYEALSRRIEELSCGPISEFMASERLLLMDVSAESHGWHLFSDEHMRGRIDALERHEWSTEVCHHICTWSLLHHDREMLQRCIRRFAEIDQDFRLDYAARRALLILALLEHQAQAEDVIEFLKVEMPRAALADFKRVLEPELLRQGLFTASVQACFEAKLSRLLAEHVYQNRREILSPELRGRMAGGPDTDKLLQL